MDFFVVTVLRLASLQRSSELPVVTCMHACMRTSRHGECIHAGSLNEQGVPRTTVTTAPTHLSRPYTSHVHVQCSVIMVPRGCDLFYMLDSRARARARPTCWYQHALVPRLPMENCIKERFIIQARFVYLRFIFWDKISVFK